MKDIAYDTYGELGIQDFFNVFVSGAFFILCIFWIHPQLYASYFSIEMQVERYLSGLIICYICGISLQAFGSILDDKIFKIYKRVIKGCFRKESKIFNKERLKVYRKYGKKILASNDKKFKDDFTDDQCNLIYINCAYYIEILGKKKNVEKMRALFDLSRTLVASCLILLIINFFHMISTHEINNMAMIRTFIFLILLGISYIRAQKYAIYKVRMVMGVYDACVSLESKK